MDPLQEIAKEESKFNQINSADPHLIEIEEVFQKFEEVTRKKFMEATQETQSNEVKDSKQIAIGKEKEEQKEEGPKMSEKKLKKKNRMTVYELKMETDRPDLVDNWDVSAPDPKFLITLKKVRNTIPVPKHWAQKRRYLMYKRGVSKIPFRLPSFIENTGITQVRQGSNDAGKTLKQRLRERILPKMGKIDIDYNILHDAFFKHQKKEKLILTTHGEIYFEGKENEIKRKDFKPGRLSPTLC